MAWDDFTLNHDRQNTTGSNMYHLRKLIVDWLNESRKGGEKRPKKFMAKKNTLEDGEKR